MRLDPGAIDVELQTIDHDVTFLRRTFEDGSLPADAAVDKRARSHGSNQNWGSIDWYASRGVRVRMYTL